MTTPNPTLTVTNATITINGCEIPVERLEIETRPTGSAVRDPSADTVHVSVDVTDRFTAYIAQRPPGRERGMELFVARENDYTTFQKLCPHCRAGFAPGQRVFASHDGTTCVHATCVEELFHFLHPPDAGEVEAAFQQRLHELFHGQRDDK